MLGIAAFHPMSPSTSSSSCSRVDESWANIGDDDDDDLAADLTLVGMQVHWWRCRTYDREVVGSNK